MNLSMGTFANTIPRLIEFGYIQGGLYPNSRDHDSWRLYLTDTLVVEPETIARPKTTIYTHHADNMTITITIEEQG
ncbi:MAG: hypothetical protein M3Z24_10535 [Chloroflexota bacterium]|nr:hypothetical protein [Chloroflexota bacterium]